MADYFFGTDQSMKNVTYCNAESVDMESLIMGHGLHPHWTLRKLCKDPEHCVLDAWLHHLSFLMASHVLLLLCSILSNVQPVIRIFSGGSKKLIKAAAEKTGIGFSGLILMHKASLEARW